MISATPEMNNAVSVHHCRSCDGTFAQRWTCTDAKSREQLQLGLCQNCGLVQQVVMPGDDALKIYYSHNYREDYKQVHVPRPKHVRRAGMAAMERLAFMQRAGLTGHGGRLLDIGAGGGEFCYLANRAGFLATGIEPHQGYSAHARDAYAVEVRTAGIDDLMPDTLDVVTLFHVVEHLAHPQQVAERLWQSLRVGGWLVVEVPNVRQADASPHNIFFRAHLYYYCRDSLATALSRYFEPVHVEDHGNLFMALRRRPEPLTQIQRVDDAARINQRRLERKGWLEYLTVGGGWRKPGQRFARHLRERQVKTWSARQILDTVFEAQGGVIAPASPAAGHTDAPCHPVLPRSSVPASWRAPDRSGPAVP